ncbi:hypothetical protein FZW96_11270 [Bacillus sp. BGMRC 2118]|nr:hypothetical protein FZW96_11270 [Bacillus sp. BGMRC 2118]
MYKWWGSVFITLILLTLAGCQTEKEIEKLIAEYVMEQHEISQFEIIHKGKNGESEIGERSYVLQQTEEPKVKFKLYVGGLLKTKVVGDDYKEQLEAYKLGRSFVEKHESVLKQAGYEEMDFRNTERKQTKLTDFEVEVTIKSKLSMNDKKSTQELYDVVSLLNKEKEYLAEKGNFIDSIVIHYPYLNKTDTLSIKKNVASIKNYSDLEDRLLSNSMFVNHALFEQNYDAYEEFEEMAGKFGFTYAEGLTEHSIYCNKKELDGLGCKGFTFKISGENTSDWNLNRLSNLVYDADFNIPVKRILVPSEEGDITLEGFN